MEIKHKGLKKIFLGSMVLAFTSSFVIENKFYEVEKINHTFHGMVKNPTYVSTSSQLKNALEIAKAGDEIILRDGIYVGNFKIPEGNNGTEAKPIFLHGSKKAILDGSTTQTGYVLHLQANYWHIKGISITNGLKGLMCDKANYNVIDSVSIYNIGEEGLHLRQFSTHNILKNNIVTNTGIKTADYGEGIYIGMAVSNWSKYTNGREDRCDSNIVVGNKIGPGITAECIDIKEGTTGNMIVNNIFDAAGITGANSADSWMDVKGNGTLIEGNTGYNKAGSILKDGYQVHCAVDGWGNNNIFRNNICEVYAAGYGFNIVEKSSKGNATGNKVYKNNKVVGAGSGVSNVGLE